MEIIDRMLAEIRFTTKRDWIECYLHHTNLQDKPFTVVERHEIGNHDFTVNSFDDEDAARAAYAEAAERVKESIRDALRTA